MHRFPRADADNSPPSTDTHDVARRPARPRLVTYAAAEGGEMRGQKHGKEESRKVERERKRKRERDRGEVAVLFHRQESQ